MLGGIITIFGTLCNAFILSFGCGIVIAIINLSKRPMIMYDFFGIFLICLLVTWIIALLFARTALGFSIFYWMFNLRKLRNSEKERLAPLIENASFLVNQKLGSKLNPHKLQIVIQDEPLPNAFNLGRKCIGLSTGMLEFVNDEQLQAVIINQLGHLAYKNSTQNLIFLSSSFVTIGLIKLNNWALISLSAIRENVSTPIKVEFLAYIAYVPLFFTQILALIGKYILQLNFALMGRTSEYRADQLVKQLGYDKTFIQVLEQMQLLEYKPQGILDRISLAYPKTIHRILKLEK